MRYPQAFQDMWRAGNTKAAFVSEAVSKKASDCQNCGGAGMMATFIAVMGPFDNLPVGKGIIAHYANGKWWGGANFTAPCPVCGGSGRAATVPEQKKLSLAEYQVAEYHQR